jgi:hypothetical protein
VSQEPHNGANLTRRRRGRALPTSADAQGRTAPAAVPALRLAAPDVAAVRERVTAFETTFGRPPAADEPLLFDPAERAPVALATPRAAAMFDRERAAAFAAGEPQWQISAWQETGLHITAVTADLFTAAERSLFTAAGNRYQ